MLTNTDVLRRIRGRRPASAAAIAAANAIEDVNRIVPGQRLTLPSG